jgi:phosphoribosyl-ATP pyrophosphohydrolase
MLDGMTDSINRLYHAVLAAYEAEPSRSRTARLLRAGREKMARKLAEEAVEVLIDAMADDRAAVIRESADLLYHLVVLWSACGIVPEDVWHEMDRRERLFGIAEKVHKTALRAQSDHHILALDQHRVQKRR